MTEAIQPASRAWTRLEQLQHWDPTIPPEIVNEGSYMVRRNFWQALISVLEILNHNNEIPPIAQNYISCFINYFSDKFRRMSALTTKDDIYAAQLLFSNLNHPDSS